jgi:hypothetical protein
VEDFYNTRNPHAGEYHFIGDYIVPTNKRRIVIYIAHGPIATARKISRIYYKLPVNPIYANMFDADAEPGETLPAEGPLFKLFDVPAEHTASTLIDVIIEEVGRGSEEGHLALWTSEVTRVDAIGRAAGETFPRRRAANKIVSYWMPMRRNVMEILTTAGIKFPGAAAAPAVGAPAVAAVNAPAVGAPAVAAVGAPVVDAPEVAAVDAPAVGSRTSSFGGTPGRSSSGTRRRRLAERLRRKTRTKSNSDPSRLTEYYTDPATGKRMRRRRPNSDPRED